MATQRIGSSGADQTGNYDRDRRRAIFFAKNAKSLTFSEAASPETSLPAKETGIQVELNNELVKVSKHILFALAAQDKIGPKTKVVINGMESTAGSDSTCFLGNVICGPSFRNPQVASEYRLHLRLFVLYFFGRIAISSRILAMMLRKPGSFANFASVSSQ